MKAIGTMIALWLTGPWFEELDHGLLAPSLYNKQLCAGVTVQGIAQYIEAKRILPVVHCESQQSMIAYNESLL